MPTYTPNIPAATDKPSDSQSQIQDNFTTINTYISQDHVAFNAGANQGWHTQLSFPNASSGAITPTGTQSTLYPYLDPVSSQQLLAFDNASTSYQLTFSQYTETGNDGLGGTYVYYATPWGLKFFMGQVPSAAGGRTITLSGATGFGAAVYTQHATPLAATPVATGITVATSTKTAVINSVGAAAISWFVITT